MQTKKEYEDYFQAWRQALKEDYIPVKKYYSAHDYSQYLNMDEILRNAIHTIKPLESIFNRIGEIYINNFYTYYNVIWPILSEKSQQLNEKIENGLIERWETVTGYKFLKDRYYVVLFYAGKQGPSWNNLSFDKNSVFYNDEEECMLDMISHELGIHVLLPHLGELFNKYQQEISRIDVPDVYGNVAYNAFESLATFYNRKVLNRGTHDFYEGHDMDKFLAIYSELYDDNLDPLNMYNEGVKRYLETIRQI